MGCSSGDILEFQSLLHIPPTGISRKLDKNPSFEFRCIPFARRHLLCWSLGFRVCRMPSSTLSRMFSGLGFNATNHLNQMGA